MSDEGVPIRDSVATVRRDPSSRNRDLGYQGEDRLRRTSNAGPPRAAGCRFGSVAVGYVSSGWHLKTCSPCHLMLGSAGCGVPGRPRICWPCRVVNRFAGWGTCGVGHGHAYPHVQVDAQCATVEQLVVQCALCRVPDYAAFCGEVVALQGLCGGKRGKIRGLRGRFIVLGGRPGPSRWVGSGRVGCWVGWCGRVLVA